MVYFLTGLLVACIVGMNVLFYSALSRSRYWFNAFPASEAIAMLERHPVPKSVWRRAA